MITKKMTKALDGGIFWRIHIWILIFILGFFIIAPPWTHAQVPRYINYQGKLLDAEDNPVTADVSVTIRIYDAETGGNLLWTEVQAVTVTRGIFSMLLGKTEDLDSLAFNEAYWYSVEVESDGEMTPRQRLTTVAYSINTDRLDGFEASEFLRADGETELTGDLTITGGVITAGANEDITIDPTGLGNIAMNIDSTSGDFKVTDGTTNWLIVDSETGDVTIASDLTVNGIIYGTLASSGGDSTFTNIVVTGTSDLQGAISSSTGVVSVADTFTQTGASNQVTFAGNVDANNGLDVTGALTASGQTTLSNTLDLNSNLDLDYSGTSPALDVNQQSTGAAAKFAGQRVVVGESEISNAYALSAGELYVQGDLEVDGTIYGDIASTGSTTLGNTTLDSLIVTGNSDLQGNVDVGGNADITGNLDVTGDVGFAGGATYKVDSTGAGTFKTLNVIQTDSSTTGIATTAIVQPTHQDGGLDSDTAAIAMNVAPTVNYTAGSKTGSYTALKIAATETSLPDGTNYLIDAYAGADATSQKFYVDNSGNAMLAGGLDMSSNKITNLSDPTLDTDAATKTYVDSALVSSASGWTDDDTDVYLVTTTDNVGIGTTTPSGKLDVRGDEVRIWTGVGTNTNAVSSGELYVEGDIEVDGTIYGAIDAASSNISLDDAYNNSGANPSVTVDSGTGLTLQLTGADFVVDGLDSSDVFTLQSETNNDTSTMYIVDTATANQANLRITPSDGGVVIDTPGSDELGSVTVTDEREALAIATDPDGAGDVDGLIKLGKQDGEWEYIHYDASQASAGKFVFSAPLKVLGSSPASIEFDDGSGTTQTFTYDSTAEYPLSWSDTMSVEDIELRGGSPASLSFGADANRTSLIYDPDTDEIRFTRGTFAQHFRNMVKNASFEAFSIMEEFHDSDPNYATTSDFGGTWDTTYGYQGGWDNFAPDDWDYVSGDVFHHSPLFFKENFTAGDIDSTSYEQDFAEGRSAVRLAHDGVDVGKISQVITGLKPSTVYTFGTMMRVEAGGSAKVDILNEDEATSATLTAGVNDSVNEIQVNSVSGFPAFGVILIGTERIRYDGLDRAANSFVKLTRGADNTTAAVHNSGATASIAPFLELSTSSDTSYTKFEGQFSTDDKASDVTLELSAESGVVYFDAVQVISGGTVPEYSPNTLVDTGDQTVYGSLRVGRSSDDKGGILSVDKFVRTRGIELFGDDPGLSGAIGGGGTTMGGGGVFPPGPGYNDVASQPATVQLYAYGDYSGTASTYRNYKVVIDGEGTPDTFKWYYSDESTSWVEVEGGNGIDCSTGDIVLAGGDGITISFSSTTSGTQDDVWYFSASNENYYQDDFSYGETTAYIPGKSRIYMDPDPSSPYFNHMVFKDGTVKVSLSELAASVNTQSMINNPLASGGNLGGLGMAVSGNYTGSSSITYRVRISYEGTLDTDSDEFEWSNDDWATWSASTPITANQQFLEDGIYVDFWENNPTSDGYYTGGSTVGPDEWTFNAYPGSSGTVVVHDHATSTAGGVLNGTPALNFTIGDNLTADPQDVTLNFHDYESGAPNDRYIRWNDTVDRFVISNPVTIAGGLALGSTNLSEVDLTDLTDGADTTLHTHTGLVPGDHATTHMNTGGDRIYWDSLDKASSGDGITVSSQISTDIATHAALTVTHGVAGDLVGTIDAQTLTNKTLTSPNVNEAVALAATSTELNLLSGETDIINQSELTSDIATHAALTVTHGVAGDIVGTSDVQTLTNKTINAVSNGLTVGTNELVVSGGNVGVGTDTPGAYKLNVSGGNLYVDGDIVLSGSVDGVNLDNTLTGLTEGEGIDITGTGHSRDIAAEDASYTNKGVASFNSDEFTVATGAASIKVDGIDDTHLDLGTGAGQIATADIPEQTNLYYTDNRVDTRLDTDQTIAGNWDFSNPVTIAAPTADSHASTRLYVDQRVAGLSWKEAGLSLISDNTLPPPTENPGDRYVLSQEGGAPHANWDGASAGDMVEFKGGVWVDETPEDGDAVFIENIDTGYTYTGTTWTPFTGSSAYTWGDGLDNLGNDIFVGEGTGITVGTDTVGIDNTVVATLTDIQTLTNKTLTSPNVNEAVALAATSTELNLLSGETDIANQSEVNSSIATHAALTVTHGVAGDLVGTIDAQTLTNKTLTSPNVNEAVALAATSTELNLLSGET
ncbi:hypothetical protein ACFL0P_05270, partial [Candidatus Omnitrophota bacterium]